MSATQNDRTRPAPSRSLSGVRVFDLTRILAGPTATQLLGDLGADILKIEHPRRGDDTRDWGPPFVKGKDGRDTRESAYYLCANRNKRSVAIDLARPEGRDLAMRLLGHCDVLIENFKHGGLAKYGLAYDDVKARYPGLVYCSITGFGQTGPYADRPGYDYLAQGAGGIMSITGAPDGPPMKVGVGIADVMCGMYAVAAILAALRHRDRTGDGQYIDISLLDCQVAWLINAATNHLLSGEEPRRLGNAHPNIVPYRLYEVADGYVILAVGNDQQFAAWCAFAGVGELAADDRFRTNDARVRNRAALEPLVEGAMRTRTREAWVAGLTERGVPCGPVNTINEVFTDPHILERDMLIEMPHPASATGKVRLVGNPVKFSRTPVAYDAAPPTLGQHTDAVLKELLGLTEEHCARMRADRLIR